MTESTAAAIKNSDEIYCRSCGKIIKKEAITCVYCGVPVTPNNLPATASKEKVIAVLLAVFLGFWTWLYTFKKDAWKFWLNLGLSVVTFGFWGIVAWIWSIIDTATKPETYYRNFNQ